MEANDLIDAWRMKNPECFQATFAKQKLYTLLERIDFILISSMLMQNVQSTDILPAYQSDHSIVSVRMVSAFLKPGKGYWKMNISLLEDETVVAQIRQEIITIFTSHTKDQICEAWESMKMVVKDRIITRSKQLAKSKRLKLQALEKN